MDAEVGETLSEDELGSEDELRSDDEFQSILDTVATEESKNFDIPFTMDDLIEKLLIKKEVTDSQKKINEIVSKVDNNLLEVFVRKLFVKFSEFANSISDNDEELSKGVPEKKLNAFYKIVHQYNTSSEYKMNCLLLFEREVFLDEHMMICYDILEEVRVPVLQKKVDLLKISGGHISRRYVTNASHARIRYVAGYCVSTLRKRYTRTKKLKLYDKRKEGQIQYKQSKCNLSIIDCLKEDEHYLEETTTVPLSLMDMKRKQRQSCSLTNVTDKMFLFFIHLTDLIIQLLVNENLLKHGKELYTYCFTTVHDNKKLHEEFINLLVNKSVEEEFQEFDFDEDVGCQQSKFSALLDDIVLQADQMNRVFKDIVMLYLNVLLAQFRRDVKSANKLEKKMAHRKQIKIKGKEPKASKISKSKSKSLKAKSKKNQKKSVNIPSESEENYTDTEDNTETSVKTGKPQELCVTSATSTVGASACVDNLEELSNMERLEQQQTPEKPSDAEGLEEDDNEDICNRCQTEKNDQWIQCDSCSSWFHRRCAGLQHNKKWGKFQKEGVNWFCLDCE